MGNTDPPGPCKEGCRCALVAARPSELEKPWLTDRPRSRKVQEAMQQLETCRGVFRRGKCSGQNRLQPAPVSTYDLVLQASQAITPSVMPVMSLGALPRAWPSQSKAVVSTCPPAVAVAVDDATPPLPNRMRQ